MKHKGNGEHSPWKQKRTGGSKEDGKHSEHHAQADARKENNNGRHFLDQQKGKAEKAQGGKETQRNEDTLQRYKRGHPRQNPSS